ncbi:putative aminopeptidase YsdC [Lachnospiraceae bacterium]|nr:putative aminopeptidase YsdC [Lachnospiraceae bacterium]
MEREELKAKLKEYMEIPRLSGYEEKMARRFYEDMKQYAHKVETDQAGNVIAAFPGTDSSVPSIMIFAHMDTIGFVITCITPEGFLKVDRVGGVPEKVLQGLGVRVGSENGDYYPGVFGMKSYHVLASPEKERAEGIGNLFIDIGAASEEEVRALGIWPGCPVVYDAYYKELLNDRICGSYTDDASGLTTLLQIAETLSRTPHKASVYLSGTVMEEFNARGAMLAQRKAHADMAICLLGAGAGDTPDLKGSNNVMLGNGVSVNLFNFHGKGTLNGNIIPKPMLEHLKRSAEKTGIPIQRQAARGALSDSAYLQLEEGGIPCMDMGTPDRYSHSPMEVLDLKDLERTGELVIEFIMGIDKNFSLNRF